MLSYRKTLITCLLILSLVLLPLFALSATVEANPKKESISSDAMAVDIVAARPLGMVATLAGTLLFVVSLPFSALGGNTGEAWDTLVVAPAEYTFQRPLGDFNHKNVSSEP